MTPLENEPQTNTTPARAVYFLRTHACTYAHERETRARIPSGVFYGGGLSGVYQGETVEGRRRKRSFRRAGQKRRHPGKEIIASVLYRAIKIEIERNRLGNTLITPVFTHLRRFLSERRNNKPSSPTLSFCKVPLEISNECVEVEMRMRMRAARGERREVSRFITS